MQDEINFDFSNLFMIYTHFINDNNNKFKIKQSLNVCKSNNERQFDTIMEIKMKILSPKGY